jgi:hypothetical protein
MKNRSKIIYDDGRIKDFEEKLDKLDLKDMLSQLYRPGGGREPFRLNYDPGRFRVGAFFNAVYGASSAEAKANLLPVSFCGARVMFNAQNGAAYALERVGQELSVMVAKRPELLCVSTYFPWGAPLTGGASPAPAARVPIPGGSTLISIPAWLLLAKQKNFGCTVGGVAKTLSSGDCRIIRKTRLYLGRHVVAFRSDAF